MSAPYPIKTGNASADAVIAIVDAIVDRFYPTKYAELRPHRGLIYLGLPLVVAGFGFSVFISIFAQRANGSPVPFIVLGAIGTIGLLMCVLYFRFRIFFRRSGIHRYQWGRYVETLSYANFKAAELGYRSALRLACVDGTYWNFPSSDVRRVLAQVLWNLSRSGVPVPDPIALQSRLGFASFETGSRAFRRAHPPKSAHAPDTE